MTDFTTSSSRLQELFITGMRNIHAVEKQALSIMEPQLARIEHYPEVADMLRQHIAETEGQLSRVDALLDRFGSSASTIKDLGLSFTGTMAALTHSVAGDEIVKNSFANFAFEHFEIASYTSLLSLAEVVGFTDTSGLEQSLREEQQMAAKIGESLPALTRKYAGLYDQGGASEAKV